MGPDKVFINTDNEGKVSCPHCFKASSISVAGHRTTGRPVRIKCHCGQTFSVVLEYRKFHRKKVHLFGKLLDLATRTERFEILITSLSVTGLGFEVKSTHDIRVDDCFEVVFTLDDRFDSTIQEEIVIKRVQDHAIGAEFRDTEKYNFDLDFYISNPAPP